MMQLNQYIDHTLLKPTVLIKDIQRICDEAIEYKFAAVCVPPPMVKIAKKQAENSSLKVATVIGFPFGYSAIEAKLAEIVLAVTDNADELDIVINLLALKNNDWNYLANEINYIVPLAKQRSKIVKLIIESGILSDEEIIRCCELYGAAEIDFFKTSTGYAETGATLHAVELMRKYLPKHIQIKASGGIKTYACAKELIDAGASRLGCSNSLQIVSHM